MSRKSTGAYPDDWKAVALRVKEDANWCCVRCGAGHNPKAGYTLTVHHLDINPSNSAWWNLLPLCQRCHLSIQGRVYLDRPWVFDHSEWFKPYVAGWYAHHYLGESLTRDEALERIDELLVLERLAVIGSAT